MRRLILVVLLLSACSAPAEKGGENATPNNTANNQTNNGTNQTNNSTNNPTNNLPAGACSHATPLPQGAMTCRSDAECSDGCGYTDSGPGCGAQFTPGHECIDDADCGDGRFCEPVFCGQNEQCCAGEGTQCIDSCSVTGCEDDFECADDGLCVPISCVDGFTCSDGFACDAERLDASVDEHGCTPETCVSDGASCPEGMDCDDGAAGNPNGTCVPIPCGSDADCRPNEVCTTPPSIFQNGCVLADCSSDGDCACGACIADKCQPRVFVCLSPAAP